MSKNDRVKIESAQDWTKAVNFVPKKDQIIIYDGVKENGKYVQPPRIKIGDGVHTVTDLPFEPSVSIEYIDEENKGILIIN